MQHEIFALFHDMEPTNWMFKVWGIIFYKGGVEKYASYWWKCGGVEGLVYYCESWWNHNNRLPKLGKCVSVCGRRLEMDMHLTTCIKLWNVALCK
jgi:hypothetical protein